MTQILRYALAAIIGLAAGVVLCERAHANVPCSVPFTLTNGTTADATQVMANYNALIACLTNAAAAGVNTDITALNGLTTPLPPSAGGTNQYFGPTSTGGANAQIVTSTTPSNFSLQAGFTVDFIAGATNTSAMTLNIAGTGVRNVFRITPSGPQALTGGEVVAGNMTEVTYDGTQYQLKGVQSQFGGFGPFSGIASAATTDLGTVPSHSAQITGTTTITSFGASASTTFPIYKIEFASVLTLTNSAALALPGGLNIVTAANDTAEVLYLGSGNWFMLNYFRSISPQLVGKAPTFQIFLTGTAQTYTPPANPAPLYIIVEMCGGGGGGGANATNNGATGSASIFGGWTTSAGNGGTNGAGGGAGGTGGSGGSTGTGTQIARIAGAGGGQGITVTTSSSGLGGMGGASPFAGAGAPSIGVGGAAQANSCSAGAGGGGAASTSEGGGGGAGEYVKFEVSPPASVSYTVGAQGNGGAAGGNAGGNGAAGRINVYEYYN
jgi:hypothetical protein